MSYSPASSKTTWQQDCLECFLCLFSSDIVAGFRIFCSSSKLSVTSRKVFQLATSAVEFSKAGALTMFSHELSGGWNATLRCQVSCSPGYGRSGLNTYQAISVCISISFF